MPRCFGPRSLWFVLLLAGCSTSPGGPSRPADAAAPPLADGVAFADRGAEADGAPVTPDAAAGPALAQLGAAIKEAKCAGMVACGLAPDAAACLAAVTTGWPDLAQLQADVAAGRMAYDPLQAAACAELYRGANCPLFWFDRAARSAACRAVFRGLVADGGACFDDLSCENGRCQPQSCPGDDPCCAGKCIENPVLPLGEDCSGGRCEEGAICFDEILGPPTCQTRSVAGEDCWDHPDCVDGLVCVGALPKSFPGNCQEPAAAGATCEPSLGVFACARLDHWCDPADDACKPRVGVGDPCDPVARNCIGAASCGTDGKCALLRGLDEPCDMFSAPCLGELQCDETCQLPAERAACP